MGRNGRNGSDNSCVDSGGRLASVPHVAREFRVHKTTLYRLLYEGTLKGHRVGGHWYLDRDQIRAWLADYAERDGRRGRPLGWVRVAQLLAMARDEKRRLSLGIPMEEIKKCLMELGVDVGDMVESPQALRKGPTRVPDETDSDSPRG